MRLERYRQFKRSCVDECSEYDYTGVGINCEIHAITEMERLTPGYFMSTVGGDEEQILKYVQWQRRQDEVQTKLDFL